MESLLMSYEKYQELSTRNGMKYFHCPIAQAIQLDSQQVLSAVNILNSCINSFKCVYIHCTNGSKRSVAVAIIYYHIVKGYPVKQSFEIVMAKRWRAKVNESSISSLINGLNPIDKNQTICLQDAEVCSFN
jgi:protein-tyrosine phosphatase